jgi:two-component system chemotaxis sensor kinase CheA
MPMIDDQETLEIFLEDAREHLSGIENDFLAIEAAGAAVDVALVNKVFRAVHSIKGGAGFLGLDAIKDLAHALSGLPKVLSQLQ